MLRKGFGQLDARVALLGFFGWVGAQKGAYGYCAGLSPRRAMPGASATPPFAARLIPGVRKGCALAWGEMQIQCAARRLWSERAVHAGLGLLLKKGHVPRAGHPPLPHGLSPCCAKAAPLRGRGAARPGCVLVAGLLRGSCVCI